MKQRSTFTFGISITFAMYSIFRIPSMKETILTTLQFCAKTLIPALFPLILICKFSSLVIAQNPKLNDFIRRACTLFLSWIGGFPSGVSLIKNEITEGNAAEREICIYSCASIGYTIQTIGLFLCHDLVFGTCLCFAQILFSLFTAPPKFLQQHPTAENQDAATTSPISTVQCLTQSIRDSAEAMLYIASFTIVFSFLSDLLSSFLPFPYSKEILRNIFEFSTGNQFAWKTFPQPIALFLIGFSLGFGGLSIHAQIYSAVIDKIDSYRIIIGSKLLCGILTGIFAFLYSFYWQYSFLFLFSVFLVKSCKKKRKKNKKYKEICRRKVPKMI